MAAKHQKRTEELKNFACGMDLYVFFGVVQYFGSCKSIQTSQRREKSTEPRKEEVRVSQ
jgi:hypothetical protein